jgi:gluconolactonase
VLSYLFVIPALLLAIGSLNADKIDKNPPYPISSIPQLPLEVYSEEFARMLGTKPQLIHLADGFGFTEGPAYVLLKDSDEGYLLFKR